METPEFFHGTTVPAAGGGSSGGCFKEKNAVVDQFIVDDLLDFPNDDVLVADDDLAMATTTNTTEYSSSVGVNFVQNSSNSSFSGSNEPSSNFLGGDMGGRNFSDGQFSSELCVPYDDLAELEWLSNFVEESFSSEDLQKLQLISGMNARTTTDMSQTHHVHQPQLNFSKPTTTIFKPEMAVPAKARSKRSRAPPCNWTSRLLAVSSSPPTTIITGSGGSSSVTPTMSSSSESDIVGGGKKKVTQKKKETSDNGLLPNNEGRKCLHCATDKTPQWRTGPLGPKTLCNACGVRYKSGRLVPEYRPAASPTFVLTKHSNSHRKVVELRKQKEFLKAQQHHHHQQQPQQQQQFLHQYMMFDVSHGDDFLIHQHLGSDFRQLI